MNQNQIKILPKGWDIKKLGDVCTIQLGKTPYRKNSKFWDKEKKSGNIWLSISDLKHGEYISESAEQITDLAVKDIVKIPKGTMMLSFKLTLGRISFAGCDLYTNEAIASLLNLKKEISKEFIFYYFTLFDWDKAAEGDIKVKGKTLNKKKLNELKIPLPPLPEQQRIVSLLDRAFEAIDQAKANAEQNLKNAKELFESVLNEKLTIENGKWEVKKLGEVIEYDKKQSIHKNLPYVGLEHIQSNTGVFLGSIEPQEVKSSTFYFTKKHVLYGRLRPYLNKVLLPNFEGHCSTEIFPIKVKKEITREFLFYWLMTETTVKKIDATWTGARMPRANMNQVLEFDFAFPPLETQRTIVRQLDALRAETQQLEAIYQKKIDDLEELKKSILQKAFSGELKIEN
ncbi:MAG: restriction endonuclease subunit S [Bacteroidales bacterium]